MPPLDQKLYSAVGDAHPTRFIFGKGQNHQESFKRPFMEFHGTMKMQNGKKDTKDPILNAGKDSKFTAHIKRYIADCFVFSSVFVFKSRLAFLPRKGQATATTYHMSCDAPKTKSLNFLLRHDWFNFLASRN